MAGAASAHQAATASREESGQQRTGRTRRTSADSQRAQQGATGAAAAAPAALDSLSRLQQLADASPRVAQLRRLQALADSHYTPVAQLAGDPEEEELIQGKFASAELQPQLQQAPLANNTGLPDQLKSGIESLSGMLMDHVRVHFNSSQPAQLNALAYAQGSDIHLAPGQEQHLPHEVWHVVQQAQGRVRPTLRLLHGVPVNDDVGLEREADVMGTKALEGGHRADETQRSISMPIETTQQIEGDATNSPDENVANNHSAQLANGRGSAQRGESEVQRMADQRPEATLRRQVRAWQGVADGRGVGGKRQDLTPGFVPQGNGCAHPAAQLQRFSGPGEASKTILRKMNLDVVQCLRKLKNEDEAIMHFEDNLMDNLDESLDEVMKLRALGTEKNWDNLLEIIDEALEEAQSTGSSKRLLLKTIAGMDFSNLKNLATMIKVLELAQDNGYDDIEDILIKPVRKLEDAHEKVKPISAAAKEKPDSEEHEATLENAKTLSLDEVFLFFAEQQGVQRQAAQAHLDTVRDAHNPKPATFSASQEAYQKLLTNTLRLSTAKIMNYHKSAGYEYEFASFVDLTRKVGPEVELLPSHVDLARSGVMSSIFELPYKLETDSGNSLEIATPPYIFLSSEESKSILSNLFGMLSDMSSHLESSISKPDQSPLKSKTTELNASGFGQNWAFTSAADNLSATGNQKHTSGPYGQVNVSMTSKEIGKFMGNLVKEDVSNSQMFLIKDSRLSTQLFRQIRELLLFSYKPVGVSIPRMEEALVIYARYAANLIAIPSILMRQQYKDYEQKPEPNYATEVKESLGLWVKDNPHNVLLQYMYSLKDEAATFKSIVETSEVGVAKTVSEMVNHRAGDVKRWITEMRTKQMLARITQRFDAVKVMTAGRAKMDATKEYLEWKKNEEAALQKDIDLAFETWKVNYQQQIMAELIAMNKLILGTAPPPSAKGAFLNEQFGSGLGVRKDTYLPSISATDRTLRVGEIRGKTELEIYENMK